MIETRQVTYPHRKDANTVKVDGKTKKVDDPGGTGHAIVREITVCPDCAKRNEQGG